MSRIRLYTDLDATLIDSEENGENVEVFVRPGAVPFLKRLAKIGDLWLVTHGTRDHARNALRVMKTRPLFKGLITREDLYKRRQVAPPGFIFDDFPVGSWLYNLKATALGIDPYFWIKVEPFRVHERPDRGGLDHAFKELVRRVYKRKRA